MERLNRRDFAGMLPALVGAAALAGEKAGAQGTAPVAAAGHELKQLSSGTFKPQPGHGSQAGHESHPYLAGMLKAGDIRLEMHESVQQPGAEHEAVGTHKHSEIWLIERGVASLYINGTEHRMEAGDVGLVCAGDEHWIKNAGDTELAYFVVTVGPPE